MTREEMAREIGIFFIAAPDNTYLARFTPKPEVDTFVWVRGTGSVGRSLSDDFDIYAHKGVDNHVVGIGRFRRYIKQAGTFNKAFYLDPDNTDLAD